MLIDCTHCQARVDAKIRGEVKNWMSESECIRVLLLECPACSQALVAQSELVELGQFNEPDVWSESMRVWPEPTLGLFALSIPEAIRTCLLEARKCLHATAYTACVAMSGRGIEEMCRHFGTKKQTLFEGLKELSESGIIDKRLYEWGDELRKHRNLAAHASGAQFNLLDAKDLYEFSTAICEYVFVLTARFEAFKKRQTVQEQQS